MNRKPQPLISLAAVFMTWGMMIVFALIALAKDWDEITASYIRVPAQIVRAEWLGVRGTAGRKAYAVDVKFTYSIDGKSYVSEKYSPHPKIYGRQSSVAETLRKQVTFTAYVDANHHDTAFVYVRTAWEIFGGSIFCGSFAIVYTIIYVLYARRNRSRSSTNAGDSALQGTP